MCALGMDEKGDLYLYKFALLCKNEIIKRLINGSYHLAETSNPPSTIGNRPFAGSGHMVQNKLHCSLRGRRPKGKERGKTSA